MTKYEYMMTKPLTPSEELQLASMMIEAEKVLEVFTRFGSVSPKEYRRRVWKKFIKPTTQRFPEIPLWIIDRAAFMTLVKVIEYNLPGLKETVERMTNRKWEIVCDEQGISGLRPPREPIN